MKHRVDTFNMEHLERPGPINSDEAYLQILTDHKLLSFEEEQELGQTLALGKQAAILLERVDPQPSEHERAVAAEQLAAANNAREVFVRCNQRMVLKIAKEYERKTRSLALIDLVQEGNIGLLRAIEDFDYQKGFRFYTYAKFWVRQSIINGMAGQDRTIRLPHEVGDKIRLMREHEERILARGMKPTDAAIAGSAGLEEQEISRLRDMDVHTAASLDKSIGDDGNITLANKLKDENGEQAIEAVLSKIDATHVVTFLQRVLQESELDIFLRRRAMDEPHLTIGQSRGITDRGSRKIEQRANRKIEEKKYLLNFSRSRLLAHRLDE